MAVTDEVRAIVLKRAAMRCEYCQIRSWPLTVDHILPRLEWKLAQRLDIPPPPFAPDDAENLAVACWPCNRAKWGRTGWLDPETGSVTPLFHPRQDQPWEAHFVWEEVPDPTSGDYVEMVPCSEIGEATVAVLEPWREVYRDQRRELIAAARCGRPGWP